jgi:4-amino-4-deoxy-L-arabinose transferase-like glycosyltransferase
LVLAGIFLLGCFLRFYQIGFQDFWRDEAFSLVVGRQPLDRMWQLLLQDFVHPPLHYLMLHYWVGLFGKQPSQVRALSAVFGTLSILAVYRLGSIASGRAAALLASGLFAVSWMDVKYSQENRPYEVATFWTLAALVCFVEAVSRRSARKWACFVFASALAMYTHYYTFFPLAGLVLWSATSGRKLGIPPRWWFAAAGAFLPLVSWLQSGVITRMSTSPKLTLGSELRTAGLHWWSLGSAVNYFNGGKWLGDALQSSFLVVVLGLLIFTLPAALAVRNAWRERDGHPDFTLLMAATVAVPFLAVGLLGSLGIQYGARYVIFGLGPYYLLAARGILTYTPRQFRIAALTAALLFSYPALHAHYSVPFKFEVSRGFKHLISQSRPGDCVAFGRTRSPSALSTKVPMEWLAIQHESQEPRTVQLESRAADQLARCLRLWTAYKYDNTGPLREHEQRVEEAGSRAGTLKVRKEFAGLRLALWEIR